MIDLEKILELESKATPGPWFADVKGCCEGDGPHGVVWFELEDLGRTAIFESSYWSKENEILTAYMRNNIRQICLELQAAREAIELLENIEEFAWDVDREKSQEILYKYHEATNGKG